MNIQDLFASNIPIFLAPMAGVTDLPFRDQVLSFGASAVVSEMVSSEALIRHSIKTYRRLINQATDSPNIVQIVGYDPKNMAEAAVMNEDLGADVIDINMGCPARKITSNESGSALMKNEKLAREIVKSVIKSVKIPVTVKMRLGWDSQSINFKNLAKQFEEEGIQMLTIHCRTRNQMYSGQADWAAISELRDITKIPYLCNGDIKNFENASSAMEKSRAHGLMIGRAALGRPWILSQLIAFLNKNPIPPTPSLKQQFEIAMDHFQKTLDFYGESHGICIFRKHFCWYTGGMVGSSYFRETINRATDISFIKDYVRDFYAKNISEVKQER